MKKRVLCIILCVIMLCSLLPTAALAVEGVPDVKYINVTGGTELDPTFGFGEPGENTTAVYISGSGVYEVADDCSGIATIINDTAVTIEGGAVNTEDVYIFGEGSLTVGDVTVTSGHEIELSDDTVDAIFGAVMTEGSDVVDISGTITAGTELVVRNAIISGALEFAAGFEEVESGHLTISGGGSLTVEEGATVIAAQDARITALSGVTINGIALYDADTSTKLSDVNDSYTVEAEVENFIWLENGENSESIQKWVLMVDGGEGDPNAPQNNEYWFEYDWRDDATVMLGEESIPSRWSEDYTDPINFTANEAISFTLTPPSDGGTYNSPVVEVEVFDWTEEKPYNTVEPLTATDGTYAYTPTSDSGFVVRVWWTTEEYDYDTFGPGEGEIAVEVMINGSESATVTSDTLNGVAEGKKRSVGTKTKYILDESVESIDLLITPGENEQINDIIVGWEPQEFAPDENGSVSYTWILSDENSHYFEAVFGGTGGEEGGGSNPPQGPSIAFDVDEDSGDLLTANNGTFTFSNNGTPLGTFTVTLVYSDSSKTVYAGNDVSISLENVNSVEIVMTPAEGQTADLITGGDTPEGALTGPTIKDGTYTYTVDPSKFNNNVLAMGVWFGTGSSGGEDFTAVIWDGDQVENTSTNGSISVSSVVIGETTYTYKSEGKFENNGTETELIEWYGYNKASSTEEAGVRIKNTAFGEEQDAEVYINFVFKPDYGYQVTGVGTNENPTSLMQGVSAAEAVSTFKFPVFCNNNPHFTVVFSPSEDVTDVSGAQNVSAATIADGQNATDSGNLKLTVADLSGDELNDAQSAFANQMQATDDADHIMYLDVDLFQVVSKGTVGSNWETQLTDLEGEISVTLNVGAQAGVSYYVIRQHTAQDGTVTYTRVQATNNGNGTITFTTNQFSTYAIGYTPGNDGDDTPTTPNIPSVPGIPTTPDTPTDDKVDIPVSGDDETIHVGATVSGDTVTVDEIDIGQLDGVIGSDVDTGTVTIDFSGLDSTASVTTVELPANVVKEIAEAVNDPENDAESLEIVMPSGISITFDADALSEKVSQADGADITISIESHEDADLTDAQKDAVGSRPAFDINVTSGGEHISNIGGKITIGAPYELKNNEKENGLVVWYVDNEGNRERCQGSYDPVNKRMNWETDHFSLYMIDYCPSATFADLDIDAWYTDSTDFVIANGLMNGIGGDKFDPDGTTSRAMIVTILWRLEGEPVVNSASVFNDVENGQWYSDAIAWANMNGIVEGYDGKFDPTGEITREQFATILWRYAKYKGYDVSVGEDTNILSYEDAFSISEYAIPAMQWACGAGLMQGDGVNLTPKADATRAQAAALFQRFCENVAEK